jgi:ubiquinone/menaquinone biosynthesis C-methylase UbiE
MYHKRLNNGSEDWNLGMQAACCKTEDRHLPTFVMDNFVRCWFSPPKKKVSKFLTAGSVVADVGCGPGYFTIPMAELVGSTGKVYAADSDPKSIKVVRAKSEGQGLGNIIEAHATSAANLGAIPDRSVDFVFANAVLCCMVDHAGAVAEIKRILKPQGLAYLSVTKVFRKKDPKAVTREEWERILEGFRVREIGEGFLNRWATASINDEVREVSNANAPRASV